MNKSIKNIVFGVLGQIIVIATGIVLPRLFILSYGSEVNGMLTSVNNIFTYIALLEAGVGTATIQALYGPIAKSQRNDINQILSATDLFYKKVGSAYLLAIVLFAAIYPFCVKSQISKITIVLVILFIGLSNVINFYFQGKFKLLLQAEGKQYIITNVTTIIHLAVSISKIVLISLGMSVVAITVAQFIFNIVQMIYYSYYIKKYYKWVDLKVKPNKKAISQSKNVIVHQVTNLVFNNTDTIILSVFCGFSAASIYALYNMLFDMISTLLNNINNGFIFKMGQLYNSDKDKFKKYYEPWDMYFMAISFALYTVLYIFICPFLGLYTKGADIIYVDKWLPILFMAVKILVSGRATSGQTASMAGHFKQTQWRSVIEMIINIVITLVCVNLIGIYGVLIGTIVALLYRTNDMIIYNCKHLIERSIWKSYKRWIVDISLFLVIVFVSNNIYIDNSSYLKLILYVIPFTFIICLLYFIIPSITEPKTFKLVYDMGLGYIKSVFRKKRSV